MANKECPCCQTVKGLVEFYKDSKTKDGRGSWCRECVLRRHREKLASMSEAEREELRKRDREARVAARERNRKPTDCQCCGKEFLPRTRRAIYCSVPCQRRGSPDRQEKVLAYAKMRHVKSRDWLHAYKLEHGCHDCGYNSHAEALQFDHEGTKMASISELRWSIPRMLEEIEKGECVVRCANCHAIKTRQRLLDK